MRNPAPPWMVLQPLEQWDVHHLSTGAGFCGHSQYYIGMSQTIKDLGGQRLECLCLVLTIQLLGPPVMLDGLENQLTI